MGKHIFNSYDISPICDFEYYVTFRSSKPVTSIIYIYTTRLTSTTVYSNTNSVRPDLSWD